MKLKGRTIIFLGATKFDDTFESTSFNTAKYLAIDNEVFYADYPYTWKDYLLNRCAEAFKLRKKAFFSADYSVLEHKKGGMNIIILPLLLSINFLPEGRLYRYLLRINESKIASRINKVLGQRGIKAPVFINSFNFHYPGIGKKINALMTVYQCVDPLIIDHDRKHGLVSERQLVRDADLVVCTSKQLYREKKQQNPDTYFIPNAADLSHSSKTLDTALAVHPALNNIPGPIIGYFGNIERRMDFDLLTAVVGQNPAKTFVFAGPLSQEFLPDGFKDRPNVHFIGKVPFDQMPSVLKGFHVAIIPFKTDGVSGTIFPLKLFEYLGSGKPVVASDFNPDLVEFTGETVPYCKNPLQFSAALDDALLHDDVVKLEQRLAVAADNTWQKRLEQFSELLEQYRKNIYGYDNK